MTSASSSSTAAAAVMRTAAPGPIPTTTATIMTAVALVAVRTELASACGFAGSVALVPRGLGVSGGLLESFSLGGQALFQVTSGVSRGLKFG